MYQDWMKDYDELVFKEEIEASRRTNEAIANIRENGTLWQKFRLWSILNLGI